MKRRIAERLGNKLSSMFNPSKASESTNPNKPGPKTEEGKKRIRLNAFVHGLTGQYLMINEDEQPYYDAMAEDFRIRFQPADGYEQQLLQKIIDTNWRLNVCAAVESAIFGCATVDHSTNPDIDPRVNYMSGRAQAFIDRAGSFQILSRYESCLDRRFRGMIDELETAIATRGQHPVPTVAPALSEVQKHVVTANARLKEIMLAAAAAKQTHPNEPLTGAPDLIRQTPKQQLLAMAAHMSAVLEKSLENNGPVSPEGPAGKQS